MADHGSPPGLMKDTEGGANAIKTFYLNFFNEQTKFSFTSMSFLFVMLWMIILMATTRYMRTLLTNYLKHAITEQSKEAKRLSPIKEVKKVGSLKRSETIKEMIVYNTEKLERNMLSVLLVFFPSAEPIVKANIVTTSLEGRKKRFHRQGRRSIIGDMLLEEVHKETDILGVYGYQDIFNSTLFAILLVSHSHFPTFVIVGFIRMLLSSISFRIILPIIRATDKIAEQFSLMGKDKMHDGFNHLSSCVSIFMSFLLFLIVLTIWGFDTSNIFAGLGIGGLAVGLALQTTLKDVFASFMLIADRPFQSGDYINISGGAYAWDSNKAFDGTVEHVGLRSTTIRMNQNGSVLHIPNSDLASSRIVNQREMKRRRHDVTLVLDVNNAVTKLRLMGRIFEDAAKDVSNCSFEEFAFLEMVHNSKSNCMYGHKFSAVYFVEGNETKVWKHSITELHLALLEKLSASKIVLADAVKFTK